MAQSKRGTPYISKLIASSPIIHPCNYYHILDENILAEVSVVIHTNQQTFNTSRDVSLQIFYCLSHCTFVKMHTDSEYEVF